MNEKATHVKVRIRSKPKISDTGVEGPGSERLWYKIIATHGWGVKGQLDSEPIHVEAPEFIDILWDAFLDVYPNGRAMG